MQRKVCRWLLNLAWMLCSAMIAHGTQLEISEEVGMAGSLVTTQVSVDTVEGIAGGDIVVGYDSAQLLAQEVRATQLLQGLTFVSNTADVGRIAISMAGATGLPPGGGVIVEIDFEILPQVAPGTQIPLEVQEIGFWSELGDLLPVTRLDGSINVTGDVVVSAERVLSIPSATARSGDSVSVVLEIDDASGIAGMDMQLSYDANRLIAEAVSTTPLTQTLSLISNLTEPGRITIAMAGAKGIVAGAGGFLVFAFRVAPDVPQGAATLGVDSIGFSDELSVAIPVALPISGLVNIESMPEGFPAWDVNQDGRVDILDMVLVGQHFGEVYTSAIPATLDWSQLPVSSGMLQLEAIPQIEEQDWLAVQVKVRDSRDLYGYQFSLVYDPAQVRIIGVHQSGFLQQPGHQTYWNAGASQQGVVRDIFECLQDAPMGIDGDGTLVTLYLVRTAQDTGLPLSLRIAEPVLVNSRGKMVAAHPREALFQAEEYQLPSQGRLLPNYPNPFNPETWVPFDLPQASEVGIQVHDASGRLVRSISLGLCPAGMYRSKARAAYWDGRDDVGEEVASGVYFCTLRSGDFSQTRRMVILR